MNILNRIEDLKGLFSKHELEGYIIPTKDEFNNEFLPNCNKRLEWFCGFSGSNGFLIITKESLLFFTDGRYVEQAKIELSEQIQVFDLKEKENIKCLFKQKINIGYDNFIFSSQDLKYLKNLFGDNLNFIAIKENLVDQIWSRERKFETKAPAILEEKVVYKNVEQKISSLKFDADYLLITKPDAICWLLNMRGNDVPYSPLLMCYCLINREGQIDLFSNIQSIKSEYTKIIIHKISHIKNKILEINSSGKTIQLDEKNAPIWFEQNIDVGNLIIKEDPVDKLKSVKNKVEISGFQYAHIQDGIALLKLFYWLENSIQKRQEVSEIDISDKLERFKKENRIYKSPSFPSISAFGKNSAVIHYNPNKSKNSSAITDQSVYLLDSGSQYICGTTDVTRTLHFGSPSDEQKKYYTLVLKSLISLTNTKFPKETKAMQLDSIARRYLWNAGYNYPHGTGHGVGHYLSVHETPPTINPLSNHILEPNMVLSIEPGYYSPNNFGIRMENLVYVKKSDKEGFLEFETLTLAPIAYNLIDERMMTYIEKRWLLQYHQKIKNFVSPYVKDEHLEYLQKHINHYSKLLDK